MEFNRKFGPWALITGASSGLGQAFAEKLAQRGINLVLTARSEDKLQKSASELERNYGVNVRAIAIDLSVRDSVDALYVRCADLDIGLVVSNAGATQMRDYMHYGLDEVRRSVQLNVAAHADLARFFGEAMLSRRKGRGGLLFISSIVGLQGAPYLSVYSASKAYLLSFAEALHYESRNKGLHVTAVAPGPIKTPMMQLGPAAKEIIKQSHLSLLEPERVASGALDALERNTSIYIPGPYMRWRFGILRRYFFSRSANVSYWGKTIKRYMKVFVNATIMRAD